MGTMKVKQMLSYFQRLVFINFIHHNPETKQPRMLIFNSYVALQIRKIFPSSENLNIFHLIISISLNQIWLIAFQDKYF